jgi:hypothetical protein
MRRSFTRSWRDWEPAASIWSDPITPTSHHCVSEVNSQGALPMLDAAGMIQRLLALAVIFAVTLSALAPTTIAGEQPAAQSVTAKTDFVASLGMDRAGSSAILVTTDNSGCKGRSHGFGNSAGCFGDAVVTISASFAPLRKLDRLRWANPAAHPKRSASNLPHRPPISVS